MCKMAAKVYWWEFDSEKWKKIKKHLIEHFKKYSRSFENAPGINILADEDADEYFTSIQEDTDCCKVIDR